MARPPESLLSPALFALALLAWFLSFASSGLSAWFSHDDLMNLYSAAARPYSQLLSQNLYFFSGTPRPFADLLLRLAYDTFGFSALPFRLLCFALLLSNLALATLLIRRLSSSLAVTLAATLLFAYHSALSDLYLSSGTLYDLLAFFFSALALLLYLRLRTTASPSYPHLALFSVLTILAVNSKEIALCLPLLLAILELRRPSPRDFRIPALSAALALLIAAAIRLHGSMAANPAYRLTFSPRRFAEHWLHYQRLLLYQNDSWTPLHAALFTALLVALVILLRRRPETPLAAALIFLAPLPILLIEPRSFYVLYLPYLGYCLLAASTLAALLHVAWPRGHAGPVLATLALALWLAPQHRYLDHFSRLWYSRMERSLILPGRTLTDALPALPRGARILFLEDPFTAPEDQYSLVYLTRLALHDLSVEIVRNPSVPPSDFPHYTAVFRLTSSRLERLR